MRTSLIVPLTLRGAAMAAMMVLIPTPAYAFEVLRVKSAQGIEAWLVETPELPVIALYIAFRDAGAVADPPGRQGLAALRADAHRGSRRARC
jgi:hypothetical protein